MKLIEWNPRPNGDPRDLSVHWCSPSLGEGAELGSRWRWGSR